MTDNLFAFLAIVATWYAFLYTVAYHWSTRMCQWYYARQLALIERNRNERSTVGKGAAR